MKKTVDCQYFREQIVHFQADEVNAEERRALQDHLDGCPDCSARLEVEEGMRRALAQRLRRVSAPPGLETRIRAALDKATPTEAPVPWWRRVWVAPLGATLLLAALLFGPWSPGEDSADGIVDVVGQVVTVVDRDCERAGRSVLQQRRCRDHRHLNMLRVEGGQYWYVGLDHAAAKQLLLDPEMRGQQLRVEGKLYPEIRTLQLKDFRKVGDIDAATPASLRH